MRRELAVDFRTVHLWRHDRKMFRERFEFFQELKRTRLNACILHKFLQQLFNRGRRRMKNVKTPLVKYLAQRQRQRLGQRARSAQR